MSRWPNLGQLVPVCGTKAHIYCCMPGYLGYLKLQSGWLARVAFTQNCCAALTKSYRVGSSGSWIHTLWEVIFKKISIRIGPKKWYQKVYLLMDYNKTCDVISQLIRRTPYHILLHEGQDNVILFRVYYIL